MRHRKARGKLGRTHGHKRALLANLSVALIQHRTIITTLAKGKELVRVADRLISLGKRGDLVSRRRAAAFLRDKKAVKTLFDEVAPSFAQRDGGYTRIVKIGPRQGDAAFMVKVELVT